MSPDDPQPPTGAPAPLFGEQRERPPSRAAQARLSGALRDRADAYRQDASLDLTILEALIRLDEAEAAVRTLDNHRASLHAMARDLQVVVADAAVEREAESVCEAIAGELTPPPARTATGLRKRVLALTGAAAVVVALVLPAARFSPRTVLASVEGRSASDAIATARERLENARATASAVRADAAGSTATTTASRPTRATVVADKVRTILAADISGGSAATSVSPPAEVTDLAAYRDRRGGGSAAAQPPDAQPPADEPEEPVGVDVPAGGDAVPGARVPLKLELEADVEADAVDLTAETDTTLP